MENTIQIVAEPQEKYNPDSGRTARKNNPDSGRTARKNNPDSGRTARKTQSKLCDPSIEGINGHSFTNNSAQNVDGGMLPHPRHNCKESTIRIAAEAELQGKHNPDSSRGRTAMRAQSG
jgi:hypothetical protein